MRRSGGKSTPNEEKKYNCIFSPRFKGAYIDSGAVDFSDKLRTSRRKGLSKLELSGKPTKANRCVKEARNEPTNRPTDQRTD